MRMIRDAQIRSVSIRDRRLIPASELRRLTGEPDAQDGA
jgi:hypothetical protein